MVFADLLVWNSIFNAKSQNQILFSYVFAEEAIMDITEMYLNFNCRYCKNTDSCEMYAFLTDGFNIDNITSENYVCDNREQKKGIKFVSVSDDEGQ